MRFHFTDEDVATFDRTDQVRMALADAGHVVTRAEFGGSPSGADVWLHGLGINDQAPMDEDLVRRLLGFPGKVVLFQICDMDNMSWHRIPPELGGRASLFLRNHWPSDETRIPEAYRDHLGFLTPLVKPIPAVPGPDLSRRKRRAVFHGLATSSINTVLPGGANARERMVSGLRASSLPFEGGLQAHPCYPVDPSLLVARLPEDVHARLLLDSQICLAPWGNHLLTHRLFEGLAYRCLVVAQSIRATSFLDGGLEPGRHYVEVSPDLRDLVTVVSHYLEHPTEAARIADAGHEHFSRFFAASREGRLSRWLLDSVVKPLEEI